MRLAPPPYARRAARWSSRISPSAAEPRLPHRRRVRRARATIALPSVIDGATKRCAHVAARRAFLRPAGSGAGRRAMPANKRGQLAAGARPLPQARRATTRTRRADADRPLPRWRCSRSSTRHDRAAWSRRSSARAVRQADRLDRPARAPAAREHGRADRALVELGTAKDSAARRAALGKLGALQDRGMTMSDSILPDDIVALAAAGGRREHRRRPHRRAGRKLHRRTGRGRADRDRRLFGRARPRLRDLFERGQARMLGVAEDIIDTFGAVSVATAWAMAQGRAQAQRRRCGGGDHAALPGRTAAARRSRSAPWSSPVPCAASDGRSDAEEKHVRRAAAAPRCAIRRRWSRSNCCCRKARRRASSNAATILRKARSKYCPASLSNSALRNAKSTQKSIVAARARRAGRKSQTLSRSRIGPSM